MNLLLEIEINSSRERIWSVITDIENAGSNISGIESVEIIEKPKDSLVGLKWRETRVLFGKKATETMWITEAEENHYYKTRAENHGAVYVSTLTIFERDNKTFLSFEFGSKAQSLSAKLMSVIFGFMFKGATKKVILKDLEDIKAVAEK